MMKVFVCLYAAQSEACACVQMVLKCADIGHLAASVATHKRWAYQLEEEFFRQGDKEREAGLLVSPLMDRSQSGGMTRSQVTICCRYCLDCFNDRVLHFFRCESKPPSQMLLYC